MLLRLLLIVTGVVTIISGLGYKLFAGAGNLYQPSTETENIIMTTFLMAGLGMIISSVLLALKEQRETLQHTEASTETADDNVEFPAGDISTGTVHYLKPPNAHLH